MSNSALLLSIAAINLQPNTRCYANVMAVVFIDENENFVPIGRTEVAPNTANPFFNKKIKVCFSNKPDENQNLRVSIYTVNNNNLDDLRGHDLIGYSDIKLEALMKERQQTGTYKAFRPDGMIHFRSTRIQVRADIVDISSQDVCIQVSCKKLKVLSWLGFDTTCLRLTRLRPDGTELVVYETYKVLNSRGPNYGSFRLNLGLLVHGQSDKILLQVLRVTGDVSGYEFTPIGSLETSVNNLCITEGHDLPLSYGKENAGTICFKQFQIVDGANNTSTADTTHLNCVVLNEHSKLQM